jgi:sporulation protein YlmC with PRC-barrel domain
MIIPDNNNISSLSTMVSAKVVTRDNALVGTVTTVLIDPDSWNVVSIVVRLDKTAIEAMKMKKGLFEKINVEIMTDIILTAADMIHLDEHMEGVKEKMTVLE